MAIQSPRDLFFYDLCAMYDVERKLVEVLPQLAQECNDAQARDAFMQHEQETRQQVRNLEQCFQILGAQPRALENHTVAGLKRDHDAFLQQQPPREAVTMFDLNAGYKTEHIEMAAYHSLIDAANSMGMQQCVQLFQQNLQQEEAAAKKLATIAHQLEAQAVQMPGSSPQMSNQPPVAAGPQAPNPQVAASPQAPNQPSGTPNPQMRRSFHLQKGMEVVGSDMASVGLVRDVRDNDFLVDVPMQRDLYVPFNAIQAIDNSRVVLNTPANQVSNMNWPKPPLTGA
jgi:ferritin-like metal-binding protein YciE